MHTLISKCKATILGRKFKGYKPLVLIGESILIGALYLAKPFKIRSFGRFK